MESMMEKLCGTRTEENLRTAFAGESQARNKYTYYAKKAEEDGMNQIAEIFRITALNEEQHAKIWFKELHDGAVPSTNVCRFCQNGRRGGLCKHRAAI